MECINSLSWRFFFLPLVLIYPSLIYFEVFRNEFYYFISLLTASMIISWIFPSLSTANISRPIYFEDLSLEPEQQRERKILVNLEASRKFQERYQLIQQIILAITMASILDYGIHNWSDTNWEISQFIAFIGGLASVYSKVIDIIGKIILSILYYFKKRERDKMIKALEEK
jgi:hypothetical protein